ncbi:unnamed protein product [Leptosia nina]|uniref:Vanin C-terminal domain-containing protein n=1 Tax=Leptosia nina TaxID=320188 RepID=A0AAV1JFX6_9NEOP
MALMKVVVFLAFCHLVLCRNVYKAAVVDITKGDVSSKNYVSLIEEAAKYDADIFILPTQDLSKSSSEFCENCIDNYDEITRTISNAVKKAKIYVVAHVYEKVRCDKAEDLVRSNLVFDRNGEIISVYRKPFTKATCNVTYSNTATFTSDFGVTFGILMKEDIFLKNVHDIASQNYIILGTWPHLDKGLSPSHFVSYWAFSTKSNVISTSNIYGAETKNRENIIVGELSKTGNEQSQLLSTSTSTILGDLNQYSSKVLDLKRSAQGYQDTVCQKGFCCHFHVKTQDAVPRRPGTTYTLKAHAGVMSFGDRAIGTEICSISTSFSENNTNIVFEKLSISGNFSNENAAQFPVLRTTSQTAIEGLNFYQRSVLKQNEIKLQVNNRDDLLEFSIFGRDYSKDTVSTIFQNSTDVSVVVIYLLPFKAIGPLQRTNAF